MATACHQNELMAPGPATNIVVESGNAQQATVARALPEQIVVKVTDASDRAVSGVTVTFEAAAGSGDASPPQTTTDVNGFARTTWAMGTAAGQAKSLQARIANGDGTFLLVLLHATALPGPATALRMITEPATAEESGVPIVRAPLVQLVDRYGNPVPEANVVVGVAAVGSNPHALGGTTNVATDGGGSASFCLTIFGPPDSVTLIFTARSVSSTSSSPINLLPMTDLVTPRITCA
jgi:hypothetical protein